jgi:hypothetical protein
MQNSYCSKTVVSPAVFVAVKQLPLRVDQHNSLLSTNKALLQGRPRCEGITTQHPSHNHNMFSD